MAKKEERGFRYQKRTKDDVKERANMKGGNYDTYIKPKFKQWKPKDGKNLIRILPPTWVGARHYGLDIYVNFNIGADNQAYLSLSKHGKGDDPLDEARREAQREGDKDLAKALNPTQRILYWIIDRNDEDEGPLLWAAPFTFDKSLNNLCIDVDTKEVFHVDGNDNPDEGRDVRFYKEGTGITTKYDPSKMKVLGKSLVHEDDGLQQDWLDFIADNPLPEVLNFYDYDHIKAMFDGQAGRQDDDEKPARSKRARDSDDEDEKPARTRSRAKADPEDEDEKSAARRGPRRDQEADDDEDDSQVSSPRRARTKPDPEDDEPEEKPARSRTRAKAEPEEDDDDDTPPPKSRRGNSADDEDEGGGTIRERLARRRSRANAD